MTRARQTRVHLGPLERAVMDRLWIRPGAADVASVHADVGAPRALTRNTIHSTLERLVRKGLVTRRRVGRAYEYEVTVTRAAWIGEVLDSVVTALGSADPDEVLAGFVDFVERSDGSTLDELEAMVRARLRAREGTGEE